MAKTGCPTCGRAYSAATHWNVADCPQLAVPKPTVERIPTPKLPAPSTVHEDVGTVSTVQVEPTGTVHQPSGTVPKNRAWEQRNPDRYRAWRREYDRRRRAQ